MAIHPVFIQAFYYFINWGICIFIIGMLFKGFFWKYLKVKTSFGKYVLVKIRSTNRDHFSVGQVIGETLEFKVLTENGKEKIHPIIKDSSLFYRSIGVSWIDFDEKTGGFVKPDFTGVTGHDPVKEEALHKRALYKPSLTDNKDKIVLVLLILTVIGVCVCAYFSYKSNTNTAGLTQAINGLGELIKSSSIKSVPI